MPMRPRMAGPSLRCSLTRRSWPMARSTAGILAISTSVTSSRYVPDMAVTRPMAVSTPPGPASTLADSAGATRATLTKRPIAPSTASTRASSRRDLAVDDAGRAGARGRVSDRSRSRASQPPASAAAVPAPSQSASMTSTPLAPAVRRRPRVRVSRGLSPGVHEREMNGVRCRGYIVTVGTGGARPRGRVDAPSVKGPAELQPRRARGRALSRARWRCTRCPGPAA